jgi:hypothetical protein
MRSSAPSPRALEFSLNQSQCQSPFDLPPDLKFRGINERQNPASPKKDGVRQKRQSPTGTAGTTIWQPQA